jgi:hypothetical protein
VSECVCVCLCTRARTHMHPEALKPHRVRLGANCLGCGRLRVWFRLSFKVRGGWVRIEGVRSLRRRAGTPIRSS